MGGRPKGEHMDFLNSGIYTIIAACCVFAGLKTLFDWLGTRAEGERKRLIPLFAALFIVNLLVLWAITR